IGSPVVGRLLDLVEQDPAPSPVRYNWSWGGTVTLVTRSGNRYTSTVDAPRGSGPRGIDWKDVDRKYHELMPESGIQAKRIEQILAVIHRFENEANTSELNGLLSRS